MPHVIDVNFFPGWTRKSISFSIDDGHVETDRKLLEIVSPFGIKGTFNLCSDRLTELSPEEYREFYRGHEIANHVKYHPGPFTDGVSYDISDEPFDPELSDRLKLYPFEEMEGLFYAQRKKGGWLKLATNDAYVRCIEECHRELEELFGKGSVRCFIWPYGEQKNEWLRSYIKNIPGYYGTRLSHVGLTPDVYFAPPSKEAFYVPAWHTSLLAVAERFENLPDDGKLKFLCFGVHSIDFEVHGKWGDLITFAKTYGARPDDYYYATVGDIFDYSEATKRVEINRHGDKKSHRRRPIRHR